MAGEVAQVDNDGVYCILVPAMLAARNVRAQRDRLLQLRRLLSPGDDDAAVVEEVASGLHKVYSDGLYYGSCYLKKCLDTAAKHVDLASFSTNAFLVIPHVQLYGVLLEQWHPPRPATQAQAFARIEAAYYAAMLPLDHHLPRCIELLLGVRPPPVHGKSCRSMIGYSNNPVAAADEYILKCIETGFPDPDPAEPPQAKSSVDVDQALSYLHRACSLTTLTVQHLAVAVAYLSSFLDPEEVADMSQRADERVHISEDGPYDPPCNSD